MFNSKQLHFVLALWLLIATAMVKADNLRGLTAAERRNHQNHNLQQDGDGIIGDEVDCGTGTCISARRAASLVRVGHKHKKENVERSL